MLKKPKILAFAGSTRTDSYNKKTIKVAAGEAESVGADVTLIDLRDYPMPVYDGDLEESDGLPENAHKLRALFKEHHGFLICAPEYNSSITAVLKNTIDWVSRPQPDEEDLICFKGKIVTLLSASPGGLGGLRGLVHIRAILGNIGCVVLPKQVAVSAAYKAFNKEGELTDEKPLQAIQAAVTDLVEYTAKLLEVHESLKRG